MNHSEQSDPALPTDPWLSVKIIKCRFKKHKALTISIGQAGF